MDLQPEPSKTPEQNPIREGNISLILDNYEDIFSDFDPRPYSERALSDDFLAECRRAVRDNIPQGGIELRLLVPENLRKAPEEAKIKKRLKDHFTKHYHEKTKQRKGEKQQGAIWFFLGSSLITASAMLYDHEGLLFNFLVVMLEPGGWFSIWTGLDKLFAGVIEKRPELE